MATWTVEVGEDTVSTIEVEADSLKKAKTAARRGKGTIINTTSQKSIKANRKSQD